MPSKKYKASQLVKVTEEGAVKYGLPRHIPMQNWTDYDVVPEADVDMTTENYLPSSPDGLGELNLKAMQAPRDTKWIFAKQKPSRCADAKHAPGIDYAPKEPTAESLQAFVDKHALHVLNCAEGQEFLKALRKAADVMTGADHELLKKAVESVEAADITPIHPEDFQPEGWDR